MDIGGWLRTLGLCCASAANGHVTLAPKSAMNSRRLIVSLLPRCYCRRWYLAAY